MAPLPLRPMLALLAEPALDDARLVYEPKYDGIRAIVELAAAAGPEAAPRVRLWSRLGNDKAVAFPEVVAALAALARRHGGRRLLLDGEIVALDARGEPAGFQRLQERMHVTARHDAARLAVRQPAALYLFDMMRDGDVDLCARPLVERRAHLESLLRGAADGTGALRLAPSVRGDGRALWEAARRDGGEGIVAKDAQSPYRAGQRTPEWRKHKVTQAQEFVVGGWTEPRASRAAFGALLLGAWEGKGGGRRLAFCGSVGSGFSDKELTRVAAMLAPRAVSRCPFPQIPDTPSPGRWVRPELVVEVKFTEWTDDGLLRNPVYLGLRDDKRADEIVRERLVAVERPAAPAGASAASAAMRQVTAASPSTGGRARRKAGPRAGASSAALARARPGHGAPPSSPALTAARAVAGEVERRLQELEDAGGKGTVEIRGEGRLHVSNLRKIFWPELGLTKGALMRHYARVAPYLLPALADRPLILERYPDGVDGKMFHQQRAPDLVPPGVPTVALPDDDVPRRLVGGTFLSLLYTVQLAAVAQHPWLSRAGSPAAADHMVIDLDPPEDTPFAHVLDVARFVRDALDRVGARAWPKTSGSRGLHLYVPLPPGTPFKTSQLLAQIVAALVTRQHHKLATVQRTVARRAGAIYVDCLQNGPGKSVASVYSARPNPWAGVSAPLTWAEVDAGVDARAFTVATMAARLAAVGDLWAGFGAAPGVDLERVVALDLGRGT